MNERMSVDMIVQAIAQGFEKAAAEVNRLGQAHQQSGQLIVNASGKVVDATAKAENAQKRAADTMKTRMASAAAMAAQKIDNLRKSQEALADTSGKMATGFGIAAAAGAALIVSSVQLAARVETLGVVTETLGENIGLTTTEVRELEQAVSNQGITLQASRQSIARMIQGNIDLAHATDLARLAQDAAVIAGIGSSEAFERLTTAISSGQVEMLRTMGISVTFEQGYKALAETLGKSAEKLTELEKVQARTNIVLGAGINIAGAYTAAMGTVGKNVTSLSRNLEESRRMLGEMWLPVYADVVDALTDSLKAWQGLNQETKDGISAMIGLGTAVAGANAIVFGMISTVLKLKLAYDTMNASMMIAGVGAGTFAAAIALPVTAITALVTGVYLSAKHLEAQVDAFEAAEKAARQTAKSYDEYTAAVQAAARAEGMRVNAKGNLVRSGGQRGQVTEVPIRSGGMMSEAEFIEANTRAARAAAGAMLVEGLQREAAAAHEAAVAAGEYNFAIGKSPDVAEAARQAAEMVSQALESQRIVAAGLAAGLQGALQDAYTSMTTTLTDLGTEHADLTAEVENLLKRGYSPTSRKVQELNERLAENEAAQRRAKEAMALTTAEMIYQQAAAGLDAAAALELARSMGVISESDYAVASSLAALREQYDQNKDGLISAEEGAASYAEQVGAINQAVQSLIDAGLPVTLDNIAKALQEAKGAADTADESVGGIPEEVEAIGTEADTAKGKTDAFLQEAIPAAASAAQGAIQAVKAALEAIPETTTTTIIVRTVNSGESTAPIPQAAGGAVHAGGSYWVGERGAEPFVPAVDGRILSVSQAQQAIAGAGAAPAAAGGGGDVYADFNITTQPGQDGRAVARLVVQMLSEAQRAARGGAGYAGV